MAKRIVDVICSVILIIVLSPFMLLTAILIKLTDRGPVLYKQVRCTQGGKEFKILKYRSMRVDAEKDGVARLASKGDDRITPIGRFIRAVRIDEIPQLIDVVVEHKADIFAFGRYCPTSEDKAHMETWHVEPERYRDFLDKCWAKYEQYRDSGTTFNLKDHLWTLYLYERGLFKIPEGLAEDTIYDGCNCANCHFTISAEGLSPV